MTVPATPPTIDPSVLDAIRQLQKPGAPDLVARIVGLYLEDSPRNAQSLRDCLERRDAQGAFRAAHALKSASGNVGARTLASICKDIEVLAHEGRIDEAVSRTDAFSAEYARVRAALGAG